MKCEDLQELITALVDKEVSDQERSLVESHIKDCHRCQFAYEQEQILKREIRAVGARLRAPAELRSRILSGQAISPERERSATSWTKRIWAVRSVPLLTLASVVVLLILPILYLMRGSSEPISLAAFQIEKAIVEGHVSLRKARNQAELRNSLTRSVDGKFAPMEYDLSSINLQPIGGTVQEIDGRKIVATVYAGGDLSITCFTFLGTEKDAPKNTMIFFDPRSKIKFYTFSNDGFHAVLHREGDLICILVSKMTVDELLAIVRANAYPT